MLSRISPVRSSGAGVCKPWRALSAIVDSARGAHNSCSLPIALLAFFCTILQASSTIFGPSASRSRSTARSSAANPNRSNNLVIRCLVQIVRVSTGLTSTNRSCLPNSGVELPVQVGEFEIDVGEYPGNESQDALGGGFV